MMLVVVCSCLPYGLLPEDRRLLGLVCVDTLCEFGASGAGIEVARHEGAFSWEWQVVHSVGACQVFTRCTTSIV